MHNVIKVSNGRVYQGPVEKLYNHATSDSNASILNWNFWLTILTLCSILQVKKWKNDNNTWLFSQKGLQDYHTLLKIKKNK